MKTLRTFMLESTVGAELTEAPEYKIYMIKDTLWVAYGEDSGATARIKSIGSYLTNKKGDHYDSIVDKIVIAAKDLKVIKQGGTAKMFELPVYDIPATGKTIDAWGGTIAPRKTRYMILTQDRDAVVNFFDSKGEALAWIKSMA